MRVSARRARLRFHCLALIGIVSLRIPARWAQAYTAGHSTGPADATTGQEVQEVSVVGTRIIGRTADALPISILSSEQILATGAVSGDDLLRSIPAMGGVTFNPANGQQTNNSARGDIASIDLRGAGIGDTLVLLNGRRVVAYPTSQS